MPENYYDPVIDEPAGTLVQFNNRYRTYEVGDHEYITIVGGYSGLYRNEDGEIEEIDNSLSEVSDEGDVEIGGEAAARARSRVAVQTTYKNGDSPVKILIPEENEHSEGIYDLRWRTHGGSTAFRRKFQKQCCVRQRHPIYGCIRECRLSVHGAR